MKKFFLPILVIFAGSLQLELTAFFHFGVNTFTDGEWGTREVAFKSL